MCTCRHTRDLTVATTSSKRKYKEVHLERLLSHRSALQIPEILCNKAANRDSLILATLRGLIRAWVKFVLMEPFIPQEQHLTEAAFSR